MACACINGQAQVNIITTICGNDILGFCGDGGQSVDACINGVDLLCLDNFGNLYLSDAFNNRVRKIDISTGVITTVAGKGTVPGTYSGDDGPATNAELFIPQAVFTDSVGNIYIADGLNYRVRKVNISTGIINTIAGNGAKGDSGENGPATNAKIGAPAGVYVDKVGSIFFTDADNNKIKKVDALTGILTTLAGTGANGYSGDNGLAVNAVLGGPGQPFLDDSANIFFTEYDNNRVRKISSITGIITTVAGTGSLVFFGDGGPAIEAGIAHPYGIYIDPKRNIFIGDWGNGSIRKIDGISGIITTVVGEGIQGFSGDGGLATAARLAPDGIFIDKHGTMYIADYGNNKVRMVRDTTQDYTAVKAIAKSEIKIYPNPATNELIIEGAEDSEVSVWNMLGVKVYSEAWFDKLTKTTKIDVSKLVPAMYIVQIVSPAGNKEVRRFVKE